MRIFVIKYWIEEQNAFQLQPHFFSSFLAVAPLTIGLLATWSLWTRLRASVLYLSLRLGKFLMTLAALLTSLLTSWVETRRLDCEFFFFLSCLLWLLCLCKMENTLLWPFFLDASFLTWTPTAVSLARPITQRCELTTHTWRWFVVKICQVKGTVRELLSIELN